MQTITVRDLRQRWPKAESMLAREKELIVTRDGIPVAKLVRVGPETRRRKRFDPVEHRAWQRRLFGRRRVAWVDRALAESRTDRSLMG
jgi:antitoxin (DNA-binding transcriptional repressor) of toxin-antitoxin stability system